jgi:hypothetical protein
VIPLLAVAAKSAAGSVWAAIRAVPWQAWALLIVAAAFLWYGESRADQREAEVRAEYDLQAAEAGEQQAQFIAELLAEQRKREQALAAEISQADHTHAQALQDLQARSDRTVADLRAGKQRLQKSWAACLSRPPATPSGAGGDDGAADDRIESAGRILRYAGQCDADVKWWQDYGNAVQRAVNGQASGAISP